MCRSGEQEVIYQSHLHLPDTVDVLDGVTDFSPQLLLVKHNLVERGEVGGFDVSIFNFLNS